MGVPVPGERGEAWRRRRFGRARVVVALLALAGVAAAGAVQYLRPLPRLAGHPQLPAAATVPGTSRLPWPQSGEAAVSVPGLGLLGSWGGSRPVPTASVAKVMTALLTLEAHPLAPGQQGPSLTVRPEDVTLYRADLAQGQSTLAVTAGESLTERQLLEGLLIPSGNNVATMLGRWVAGSEAAMIARANRRAAELGLAGTHFADLSGFDPGTVSTPADLIRLGETAMRDPTFAAIVRIPSVVLPYAGKVLNVDSVLGQEGLIGIKTGSDDAAGGCFLFASKALVAGRPVTIYGAVMGVPTLEAALSAGRRLARAVAAGLTVRVAVAKGEEVGFYRAPWGLESRAVAASTLSVLAWPGDTLETRLDLAPVHPPLDAHARVGTIVARLRGQVFQVAVLAEKAIAGPGFAWRLSRSSS